MATETDIPINAEYRIPHGLTWTWGLMGGVLMIATGLALTFLLASFLQWRSDARAENIAASHARLVWDLHDPARAADIQVGALRRFRE